MYNYKHTTLLHNYNRYEALIKSVINKHTLCTLESKNGTSCDLEPVELFLGTWPASGGDNMSAGRRRRRRRVDIALVVRPGCAN